MNKLEHALEAETILGTTVTLVEYELVQVNNSFVFRDTGGNFWNDLEVHIDGQDYGEWEDKELLTTILQACAKHEPPNKIYYRVWDPQCSRYFHEGYIFTTKEEVRDHLADYHSIDWEEDIDIETMTLEYLLDYGDWKLEEVRSETTRPCNECKELYVYPEIMERTSHKNKNICENCWRMLQSSDL